MKKLLVPVDGSEGALCAVRYVIRELDRDPPAPPPEVHLLNVQHGVGGDVSAFVAQEEIRSFHHDEGLKALQSARALLDGDGVAHVFHIGVGDPAEVIVHYAREKQCDEIVMATQGMGTLAGRILGSVASRVVHLSPVPVLLVK